MADVCCVCGEVAGGFVPRYANALNSLAEYSEEKICNGCMGLLQTVMYARSTEDVGTTAEALRRAMAATPPKPSVRKYVDFILENPLLQAQPKGYEKAFVESHGSFSADVLVTPGFNFEGYHIVKYMGFESVHAAIGLGIMPDLKRAGADVAGIESVSVGEKLENAKKTATDRLLKKAMHSGANAIIGMRLEYVPFGGTMTVAVASGTLVQIVQVQPAM